jgi:hypothetical protein
MKRHWTSFDISTGVETYRDKLAIVFTAHAIVRAVKRLRRDLDREIPNEFLHYCGCCVKESQEFVGLSEGIVYFCKRDGNNVVVKTLYKDIKKPGYRYGLRQFNDNI